MKSSNAAPQLRGAIGAIALMAAFSVAPVGHAFAACSGMMCGPGSSSSSSSSSGMSGRHGGGGGMLGVGIGIGAAIGAGAASQPQQPSAPPRGTPPKQRVAKPGPKPEPERKREVCSDGDIVPTIKSEDWPSIIRPRSFPELISLRYPEPDEKYVVFGRDGKIRCIAGPWNLWVYYQLMKLPWPYDRRPVAPTGKDVNDYALNDVAPPITPQDGPRFGLTAAEMANLLDCNKVRTDGGLQIILRASKPASLKYRNDPKYMAKPLEFYVKEDGTYTRDKTLARLEPLKLSPKDMRTDDTGIVQMESGEPLKIDGKIVYDPQHQNAAQYQGQDGYLAKPKEYYVTESRDYTMDESQARKVRAWRSTVDMHSDATGIVQEKPGTPLKIDGKTVFSDVDPQNVLEVAADGIFKQASTDQAFQDWINGCLGSELVMHGGEGWYRGLPDPKLPDPKG
jgi:hypothetical protein